MKLLYLFLYFGTYKFQGTLQGKIKHRIINGEEVSIKDYPYQVGLYMTHYDNNKYMCGGALISKLHVLTASHCLPSKVKELRVLIGETLFLLTPSKNLQICKKCWVNHPNDDISIITLPSRVEFSTNVQPISLPTKSDSIEDFLNKTAKVSGWGVTENGEISKTLRATNITIITHKECPENALCAIPEDGKTDWTGDSGGAIVIDKKAVGIVSYSTNIKNATEYMKSNNAMINVYTNIRKHLQWIHEVTGIAIEE